MKQTLYILLPLFAFIYSSCGGENETMKEMEMQMETLSEPELSTKPITNITTTSATSGGIISSLGNPLAYQVGIAYSKSPLPTINDQSIIMDYETSDFDVTIQGLEANTTYFIRAFAENDNAISYGNELLFKTEIDNSTVEPDCTPDQNKADINGTREYTNVYDNGSTTEAPYTITANGSQGDMKFHFSKKPVSGYYITSSEISFLQDHQCNVSAVFSNFFWNTHLGDTLYVDRPSDDIISMTFCDFTFTTSQLSFDVENAFGNVTHEE